MNIERLTVLILLIAALAASVFAQNAAKYNYDAQRAFIPFDLGEIYLGMPFKDFVNKLDITDAEADTRFDFISLNVPFSKGDITAISVRIDGVNPDEKAAMTRKVELTIKDDAGDFTREEDRIDPAKVGDGGFVYALYISFRPGFDLKSYVIKTFGNGGDVRKPDDEYHFYDIQWNKKTDDGLDWLIRSFHEGDDRQLQLLGRIPGTEWGLDEID
jgi:hypothetical protein